MEQIQLTKAELLEEMLEMRIEKKGSLLIAPHELVERFGPESMVGTMGYDADGRFREYLIVYTLDGFVVIRKFGGNLWHGGEKSIDEGVIVGIQEMLLKGVKLKKEEEKLKFILDRLKLQAAFYQR